MPAAQGRPRHLRISQASVAPISATRKVSSGAPPTAAQRAVGASAWLIASLPQGKPPHGQRSRSASAATHQPATATGQPGSRSRSRWPIASTARMTAEPPARPAHAYHATFSTQDSIRKKNATPKTSPARNDPRRDRPASATVSRAGPTAASGQMPAGGNAAARARPPARAAGSAQRKGSPLCPSVPGPARRDEAEGAAEITLRRVAASARLRPRRLLSSRPRPAFLHVHMQVQKCVQMQMQNWCQSPGAP